MNYPRAETLILIIVAVFLVVALARVTGPVPDISWEASP